MSNKDLNFRVLAILLAFLNCPRVSGLYGWGPCPSIPIDIEQYVSSKNDYFVYSLGDFRAEDYLGTWYDILRNADFPWSKGNCTKSHYYIRDDGRLGFLGSEIVNGKNISVEAEVFIDLSIPGQLWIKFLGLLLLETIKLYILIIRGLRLCCHANRFGFSTGSSLGLSLEILFIQYF